MTHLGVIYESTPRGALPAVELKFCEQCGKNFTRPAASTDKYCFQCHQNWNAHTHESKTRKA
jgi:hypothetical protein